MYTCPTEFSNKIWIRLRLHAEEITNKTLPQISGTKAEEGNMLTPPTHPPKKKKKKQTKAKTTTTPKTTNHHNWNMSGNLKL